MNSQYHNYIRHLVTIMSQYDIAVSHMITNVLCYLLLNQYYSIIPPYNMIYDTADVKSFISIIKMKYNFEVLKLNPLDIEKISEYNYKVSDINSILYTIYSILKKNISKQNKNSLQFNVTNYHVMQYIINNMNIIRNYYGQKKKFHIECINFHVYDIYMIYI